MTATITADEAGQIHLPAALGRAFGAAPGVRLRAKATLGRIEIVEDRPVDTDAASTSKHEAWLRRLDKLRASVGTGRETRSTEEMLEDLRSERG